MLRYLGGDIGREHAKLRRHGSHATDDSEHTPESWEALAQELKEIRLSASDARIDWRTYSDQSNGLTEAECFAKAEAFCSRLLRRGTAVVAHAKFGYSSDPHWRFTTLVGSSLEVNEDCSVEPHYLSWSNMHVLFGGSGTTAAQLEKRLILKCGDAHPDKVQNIRGGADGPIAHVGFCYVVWNSLDEVVAHALAKVQSSSFWPDCHMLVLTLENHRRVFGRCCACRSDRYKYPV